MFFYNYKIVAYVLLLVFLVSGTALASSSNKCSGASVKFMTYTNNLPVQLRKVQLYLGSDSVMLASEATVMDDHYRGTALSNNGEIITAATTFGADSCSTSRKLVIKVNCNSSVALYCLKTGTASGGSNNVFDFGSLDFYSFCNSSPPMCVSS
jgi:hypothetical protein